MIKSSYSYENNLLKEIKQIHKGDYILTKNYKYIDGKLVEFTELDPFLKQVGIITLLMSVLVAFGLNYFA